MYLNKLNFMFKKIILTTIIVFTILILLKPGLVSAGIVPCGTSENPEPCNLCHFFQMLQTIINGTALVLGAFAAIYIVIGGITMLISGGEPEKVNQGKRMITYTIFGIIVAFVAWIIISEVMLILVGEGKGTKGVMPWPWNRIECVPTEPIGGDGERVERFTYCHIQYADSADAMVLNYNTEAECRSGCPAICDLVVPRSNCQSWCCLEVNRNGFDNVCTTPPPQTNWCNRSSSATWPISGINPNQRGDASGVLANFLDCLYLQPDMDTGHPINSISDDRLCDNTCTFSGASCSTQCQHSCASAHYGCGPSSSCYGYSYAVDIDIADGSTTEETAVNHAAYTCAQMLWGAGSLIKCLGPSNDPTSHSNHIHISIAAARGCGCDSIGANQACRP